MDVSSVNMNNMFTGTSSFYQNISDWDVENVVIPVAYKRPFSSYGGELMAIKNNDTVKKMSEEHLAAYNTINCMKPVKFRQVLARYFHIIFLVINYRLFLKNFFSVNYILKYVYRWK